MRLRSRTPPRARRPSSGLIQNATPTIMPIVPTATFLSNGRAMLALLTFPHARGHLIKLSRSANFTTSILDRIEQTITAFRRSRSRHFPPQSTTYLEAHGELLLTHLFRVFPKWHALLVGTFLGTPWPYLYPKDQHDDKDDRGSCEPMRSVCGKQVASQEKHKREHAEPQPLKACGLELWSEAPCQQAKHKANEQHSQS